MADDKQVIEIFGAELAVHQWTVDAAVGDALKGSLTTCGTAPYDVSHESAVKAARVATRNAVAETTSLSHALTRLFLGNLTQKSAARVLQVDVHERPAPLLPARLADHRLQRTRRIRGETPAWPGVTLICGAA